MAEKIKMGMGVLGQPDVILKRKFRWTLSILTPCGSVGQHFVKSASRPQLEIEETELNFLNAVSWVPGKGRWQPITVTYLDVAHKEMEGLYRWIATVYDFTNSINLYQAEKYNWEGTATLIMYDGCGNPLERWILGSVWPQSINFGDLDYSDSDAATIELTLRYSEVDYTSLCGVPSDFTTCCTGCGDTATTT